MIRQRMQCPSCGRRFSSDAAIAAHQQATHEDAAWIAQRARKQEIAECYRNRDAPTPKARREGPAQPPLCPTCSQPAKLSMGRWGIKAECCGLWSWKLKPLVDRETHASRIHAHDAFDRLWKGGGISRSECYRRLRILMGLTTAECHIAQMTAAQCRQVLALVNAGRLAEAPHIVAIRAGATG